MQQKKFIAGDWGTSNLRLYLCEVMPNDTVILDTRFGPGISELNGDFEDKLFNLTQDWLDAHGALPILLAGMVGSNIGWKEAPYLSCPVDLKQIAQGGISFTARGVDIAILAGLKTSNPLGQPDLMRGEELQMLGWLHSQKSFNNEACLFALPGTHNKWALVKAGRIENFLTAFTGELYGLLRKHSILISDDSAISLSDDPFVQGLAAIKEMGEAQLVHMLFSVRSRQVLGEIASADGLSYLSGLIAGADVLGATKLFASHFDAALPVIVIGEPALSEQYLLALEHFGVSAQACNPSEIAIAGFDAVFQCSINGQTATYQTS